jgi:hypothetical protein
VNAISQTQVPTSAQFNTVRHAFLFKPGAYTVDVQVGYYTSVAGLGLSPDDVTINGIVHSDAAGHPTFSPRATRAALYRASRPSPPVPLPGTP